MKKPELTPIQVEPFDTAENNQVQEEEYSYYEESEAEPEAHSLDLAKRQELKKLRQLLRQNKQIPKVIII